MEKIKWGPSFSVGIKLIDSQHIEIINIINFLISDSDATVESETISEALTRLTRYTKEHFCYEESLLEKHEYYDLAHQKEEHIEYRLKVATYCKETMKKKESIPTEILQFLRDWWENHILEPDMKYKSFLVERGVT